jgi:hypothetical protein
METMQEEISRRETPDAVSLMRQSGCRPDPWQAALLTSTAARTILLASRQSGKSTTCAVLALHQALAHPRSLVLLLSPSLRQSQELFKKVQEVYRAAGHHVPLHAESALRYEMNNSSRIIALPGTEPNIRDYSSVDLLVIDEAARVSDELYFATRPMLAVSGGRLILLSTPFGRRGFFHQAWTDGEDWERIKIAASECPRISRAFLEEERRTLPPLWFQSEYLCEFVDVVDQVFAYGDVMGAVTAAVEPLFGGTP